MGHHLWDARIPMYLHLIILMSVLIIFFLIEMSEFDLEL